MNVIPFMRDPIPDARGPMARLRVVQASPAYVIAEVGRRIERGDTLRQIAQSWAIPHRPFREWFGRLLADLARAAQPQEKPKLDLII